MRIEDDYVRALHLGLPLTERMHPTKQDERHSPAGDPSESPTRGPGGSGPADVCDQAAER
jgi:hypothetical protein